jgi:hypothetical protein
MFLRLFFFLSPFSGVHWVCTAPVGCYPNGTSTVMPWVTGDDAWTIAGVFVGLSLILTTHQIYKHLKHYYCPSQQIWIVRILFMVPIYALSSWLSLKFFHLAIYFDTIRNIYEGRSLWLIELTRISLCYLQLFIVMLRVSWWRVSDYDCDAR